MTWKTRAFSVVAVAAFASGCGGSEPQAADGAHLFENYCAPCHGPNGAGNASIEAPAIAGFDQWYVEAQLHKFQEGDRGTHFDDIAGMRMRPMSLTLKSEDQNVAVAAFVAGLPVSRPESSIVGDVNVGKSLYGVCAACHQGDASGNKDLGAPPLNVSHDWYLVKQLEHFKEGVRGADPDDRSGATMAPMANLLANEQAMKDVIAYAQTLVAK